MITMDFKLPELGEGVYEVELVAWLVQPGYGGSRSRISWGVSAEGMALSKARSSSTSRILRTLDISRLPAVPTSTS